MEIARSRFDGLTSEDLAVSAKSGSEEHFGELVLRHRDRLFQLLCRKVSNREDAEDLTQEALTRAHQKIELFDPKYKFESWLFTIGTRLSYSFYRRQKEATTELHETTAVTDEDPSVIISTAEQHENLWLLVADKLSPLHGRILWLHYGRGMSVKEISKETGKTTVYVKVIMHRARSAMVRHLKENRS